MMRKLLLTLILLSTLLGQDEVFDSTKTYKEEELKLMIQSFLYKGDTVSAFQVALIGYKKNPKSLYWNKQLVDTAKWSNYPKEAIKYEILLYKKNHDPKLRDEIITYGLGAYQYELIEELTIEKALGNPNEENVNNMVFVQNQLGTPEKAAKILDTIYQKDHTKTYILAQELQLYLDMGDLDSAEKIVHKIEAQRPYSVKNATLVANYYYLKKDFKSSYKILLSVKKVQNIEDIRYYQLLSDLSWYMQDYETTAEASTFLINNDQARLADYTRIIDIYENKNSSLSTKTAGDAYSKYKLSYLFYQYAQSAMALNQYDKLKTAVENIDSSDDAIKNEARFWLIKASIYIHFNQNNLAIDALDKATILGKNDIDTQLDIFWFYLDHGMFKSVKEFIHGVEDSGYVDPVFYIPFASAYYQFNEVQSADYYLYKISDTTSLRSTDLKFLQAYIYQAKNDEGAYIKKLKEILSDLQTASSMNPEIKSGSEYWISYLNAAMPVTDADKFEQDLHFAKRYLTPNTYDEIAYMWAVQNNADEKSHKIYTETRDKQLITRFNNAVLFQNHSTIENILHSDLRNIPQMDAARAAREDGQISLAQSVTYDILDKNDFNQDAYIQHIDLSKERGDQFDSQVSYLNRDPFVQKYVKLNNRTYIPGGWDLYTGANYFSNDTLDINNLDHLKSDTYEADLGLRKRFDRSYIKVHGGYKEFLRSYAAYGLSAHSQISTDLQVDISFEKNIDADDTAALSAAGKKDMINANILWNLLNTTSIELLYEKNFFSSQDDVKIGDGDYARLSVNKQYRSGYPDIGVSLYVDNGIYNETATTHGVIDTVQNGNYTVLPNDFYNIGAEFRYGMQNSEIYTRVWRPYFSVSTYYSSLNTSGNVAVNVGYGGKVWHQDHMVIGASYSNSTYSSTDTTFEFFLRYQFMYMHP